ncbi:MULTISPECIES: DUF4157 domain-containing protein [Lysobacter]|uniref:eCIS core domain-containing protein n=1 Tax=Lysobacter TaxID=68 RepID=UPI001F4800BE|nr:MULTISPECIES: DUF4157 domain-containing protein [Lysobacter]UJB19640.1 DUF4157 domain-containing protein [Lysobacter capsici]UJQ26634.1 DUF4157 domain-containing protein [Lysobacter gummosus]
MQTKAASKEPSSSASRGFFSARPSSPSFFNSMVQAKCAACENEETVQQKEDATVDDPDLAVQAKSESSSTIPTVQTKCSACSGNDIKLQTKLTIGAPGDRFEQEADRMADTVMRSPDPRTMSMQRAPGPLHIQRESTESCSISEEAKEPDEVEEEKEDIDPAEQQTPVSPKRETGDVSPPADMESRLEGSRGGGAAMSASTRDFMESRFGYDFSGVRIHTGGESEHLNRGVRSLAFTSGRDVYFGAGQYRPDTDSGKHLLAHELTHVVQQSGSAGAGVVHEKADPKTISPSREEKPYYSGGGAWVSGTATHGVIEKLLRDHDDQLVTEAAIPGADRFVPMLNLIGVADLYKSSPAHHVTGVKAYKEADTEDRFVNMNNTDSRGTQPAVDSLPRRLKRKKGTRDWDGDFPEKIWIGELKPFATSKLKAGVNQLNSYTRGYKDFVKQANHVNGGQTRASINVERLDLKIPDYLNFDNFATQQKIPSKSTTPDKKTRLWVASAGNGVYLYTALAGNTEAAPPQEYFDELANMRKLVLGPLSEPAKTTARMKFASPSTKLSISSAGVGASRRVQRNTADRGANYWTDRAQDWEKVRSAWGMKFRAQTKGGLKSHVEKVRFEKALGRQGRSLKPVEKKEVKEYKQLMFWSGRAGKFLGKVRFMLGSAWDKALAVFEKMKTKMTGIRTKVLGMSETGLVKVSWQSRLIQALMVVCKAVFSSFITESFNFFAQCFHSAMDKVVEKFQAELDERFGEQICRARKLFEESKQKLEDEWGDVIQQIQNIVEAIQNVKRWVDICTTAVDLIRVGVQVISCLTPPGLGCLWGLVAQLGIGAMVGLVIGTQWFNDNIITPNVRQLLKDHIAPTYQNLINRVLGDGLKEYHCHIADEAIPTMNFEAKGGMAEGSAAMRAHRDSWENEFEPQIMADLQRVFGNPNGKKVTKEDVEKLLKKIQDSGLSMEEFKDRATMHKLLEQARDPKSGKLDIERAKAEAEKKEAPPPQTPPQRNINYPNARKQNTVFQKIHGWDPTIFIAKPGIKVDSDEFADAVYDMQGKVGVKQDGILGDETLVAFYDKNKKKPDIFYKESVQAIEQKKAAAEKAAKEKAEREAAKLPVSEGPEYTTVVTALPRDVKVLSAHTVPAASGGDHFPKGASINVYVVDVHSYMKVAGDHDVVDPKPSFIELDIHVDKKHIYRITNVAVDQFYIAKMFGDACYWTLMLEMTDGFTVDTPKGPFTLHRTMWCWKDK